MINFNASLSYLRWLLLAGFGLVSLPSAYLFGLTLPLGGGLSMMLDLTFFSTEIFKFTLFLAGLAAITRPVFGFALSVLFDEEPVKNAVSNGSRYILKGAVILVGLVLPAISLVMVVLGGNLLWSFTSSVMFILCFCMMFYSASTKTAPLGKNFLLGYFRASMDLKRYLADPALLVSNVSMLMALALTSGYHRTISLAVSDAYCVRTGSDIVHGALVARTDVGLILANNVKDRWVPFTLPTGLAAVYSDVFVFVYDDEIRSVSKECGSF